MTFYLEDYEVEYVAYATAMIAKYWRNLKKFYTVHQNGEITVLPIFEKRKRSASFDLGHIM